MKHKLAQCARLRASDVYIVVLRKFDKFSRFRSFGSASGSQKDTFVLRAILGSLAVSPSVQVGQSSSSSRDKKRLRRGLAAGL